MITFATIHNYNISHTPFYFVLFVDEMTHKYINMYLHINYESKFIYKYKIISHLEITIMKMLSTHPVESILDSAPSFVLLEDRL